MEDLSQFHRLSVAHYATIQESNSPLAENGDVRFMSNDYDCNISLFVKRNKGVHDLSAGLGIQVSGRFVGKYERSLIHECPCNGDPLLLSTREMMCMEDLVP